MLARFASSFIFLTILLFGLYSDHVWAGYLVFAIVSVAALVGTLEYYKLARRLDIRPSPWIGCVVSIAILVDAYFFGFQYFTEIFIACFWAILLTQVFIKRVDKAIVNTACSIFGSIYLGLPLGIVLMLFKHAGATWGFEYAHAGSNLLIFLIITSWATDSGGYLFGKPWGKHKMSPVLSPNKSWEGLAGGALLAVLFGVVMRAFWPHLKEQISWAEAVFLPMLFTVVGTVGDLAESAFKRDADIKDSGETYTGHGGMLDILDSLLLCAPVFYLYMKFLRLA